MYQCDGEQYYLFCTCRSLAKQSADFFFLFPLFCLLFSVCAFLADDPSWRTMVPRTLVLLLIIMASFLCPPPCARQFESTKNLAIHQAKCAIYLRDDPSLANATDLFAAKKARQRLKRQRKDALEPLAALSSAPAINDNSRGPSPSNFEVCQIF